MVDGKLIKKLREERKLSIRTFAKEVHSSPSTVSRWENQNTLADYDVIEQVARILGVSVDYLLNPTQSETEIAVTETDDAEVQTNAESATEEKPAKKQLSLLKIGLITAGASLLFFVLLTALIVVCAYFQPRSGNGSVVVWLYNTEEIFVIIAIVILCIIAISAITVLTCFLIRRRKTK